MKDPSLIFIAGPTAVGKSEAGLSLSRRLNGEIVCCDALQVYREVSVASDKPSARAREEVVHHLLDVVSVSEDFNAALWRRLALSAIEGILARRKTPVVVGGSGMYMSVLLDGIFEGASTARGTREKLAVEMEEKGPQALHERLKSFDPAAAAKIHPHDSQRIIRALDVVLSTGSPLSQQQKEREGLWGKLPIKIFGLNRPRSELYQRVETRIDEMFARDLVDEIKKVSALPLSATAKKMIGIPEIGGYLKGEYDLQRAKYLMKLHTRHYVKRQLTWFRHEKRMTWIEITPGQSADEIAELIVKDSESRRA